jgi:hypothetical protein
LLRRGQRATKRFTHALTVATIALDATTQLPPSERALATALLAQIGEDIGTIGQVAETRRRRVLAKATVPSAEKLVSLGDGDAAFIIKGGWDTQIGYRPQLGKKRAGLRQRAARAAGQRGRPRPTDSRRAGPLGTHQRAAQPQNS